MISVPFGTLSDWIPRTKTAALLAGITCVVLLNACVRLTSVVTSQLEPIPTLEIVALCPDELTTCK